MNTWFKKLAPHSQTSLHHVAQRIPIAWKNGSQKNVGIREPLARSQSQSQCRFVSRWSNGSLQ